MTRKENELVLVAKYLVLYYTCPASIIIVYKLVRLARICLCRQRGLVSLRAEPAAATLAILLWHDAVPHHRPFTSFVWRGSVQNAEGFVPVLTRCAWSPILFLDPIRQTWALFWRLFLDPVRQTWALFWRRGGVSPRDVFCGFFSFECVVVDVCCLLMWLLMFVVCCCGCCYLLMWLLSFVDAVVFITLVLDTVISN